MPKAIANREGLKAEIVRRLAAGEYRKDICADPSMPSETTIDGWLRADDDFRGQCAQARARAAELHERNVARLSRRCEAGDLEPDAARASANMEMWLAKVRAPEVYSEKVAVQHSGRIEVVPVLNITIAGPAPRIIEGESGDGE